MKRAYDESLVGCWSIVKREGSEIVTRWIDRDGFIVKTERSKVDSKS